VSETNKNRTITDQLVCTYANSDQRLAAYRNVHEFWSGGRSLEEHLQWRLASPQHNQAKWCVGTLDGQVVTSLGCYPVRLHWQGKEVAGILIGAVHTQPEHRGHGYAPQLLSWVETQEAQQGVCVSGLFSDIAADYYGRWGYERCDSWEVKIEVEQMAVTTGASWELQPIDPHQHLSKIRCWYEASQASLPVWIVRDEDYWQYLLARSATDQFFALVDPQQQPHGYVRLRMEQSSWVIQDWGLEQAADEQMVAMMQALAQWAAPQGVSTIIGWLPRLEQTLEPVTFEARPQEITMFKSLDPSLQVEGGIVQAAGYLREIDHV